MKKRSILWELLMLVGVGALLSVLLTLLVLDREAPAEALEVQTPAMLVEGVLYNCKIHEMESSNDQAN